MQDNDSLYFMFSKYIVKYQKQRGGPISIELNSSKGQPKFLKGPRLARGPRSKDP